MIQNNVVLRHELLDTFQTLGQEFENVLSDAKNQEQQFKRQCQKFQNNIQMLLTQSIQNLSTQNPMYDSVQTFLKNLKNTSESWNERINKQDTGVRFRETYNDSLLIFVYGKVKSGKSSLGNYMAWGHTDPSLEIKQSTPTQLHPIYFSAEKTNVKNGDQDQEAKLNKEFRVGATEATSSIQGFKLPGLTWVDSPGLHSINAENGQLAKNYVEHADLILYTMKSDSPGRASDLQEILELYRADKRLLLLLTGSDDTKAVGFDTEQRKPILKIIMKDEKRRTDQKDYVRSALNELPELNGKTNNIDIVSFSARYAQLHAEDDAAFQDSGMGELFKVIQETAATEGVNLKKKTPLRNFKNFLQHFQSDLDKYEYLIEDFKKPIERLKKNMPLEVQSQLHVIQNQMAEQINQAFDRLQVLRDDAFAMKRSIKEVQQQLQTTQRDLLLEAKQVVFLKLMNDFDQQMVQTFENSELLNLPDFNINQKIETIITDVKANTKTRNGGIGAAVGTAAGALIGSFVPVIGTALGGTAGSVLGGMLGNALGNEAQAMTKDITINVGDNLSDIQEKTLESFREFINKQMLDFQNMVLKVSLEDAEDLVQKLNQEMQIMQNKMTDLNQTIDLKLSA